MHCQADMPFTYHRLGEPNAMADAFNALIQTRLPEGRYEPYCSAAALFYYEGEYAKITQALKYDGNVHLGRHFARLAASRVLAGSRHGRPGKTTSAPEEGGDPRSGEDRLSGAAIREPFDTVVPVPLHWRRRFSRGFNQAEVIAREIARHLGVPCRGDILRRRRSTTTQTALDSSDRLSNVAGAFAVRPKALANLPSQARLLLLTTFSPPALRFTPAAKLFSNSDRIFP